MALSSIQVGNIAAAQRAHGDNNTPVVKEGKWARRGTVLLQVQPGTAQQIMRPQEAVMQGGLPAIPERSVLTRTAVAVQAFRPKTPDDVMQRALALGVHPQEVRAGARALLSGKALAASTKGRADRKKYLSHLYARALLEDSVSEEEVTARLTNTGERSQSSKQLAEQAAFLLYAQLQGGDTGQLDEFLNDVLSGLDTTAEDVDRDKRKDDLKEELGKALNETDSEKALIGVLRRAQGLDSFDGGKRQDQRQKLEEAIQLFETEELTGAEVVAGYNAAKVAATTSDPFTFTSLYEKLVTEAHTLLQAMQEMAKGCEGDVKKLLEFVPKFQEALADDLNAWPPSRDVIALGAVITDLGTTFIFSTLIDEALEHAEHMGRLGLGSGYAAAAA